MEPAEEVHRTFVRVTTSYWSDNQGLYSRKSVKYLKRKSTGHNFLSEEISCLGSVTEVWPLITNIDKVEDGIYEVITKGGSTYDAWNGDYDGWMEFTLAPYKDEI